jgi:hypothetical protein
LNFDDGDRVCFFAKMKKLRGARKKVKQRVEIRSSVAIFNEIMWGYLI